jgi:hypothetical protein
MGREVMFTINAMIKGIAKCNSLQDPKDSKKS